MNQVIYEKLKSIARAKDVITYGALMKMIGLDTEDPSDRSKIAKILDEINRYEVENRRPMLSSVVIRQDKNMPGQGFFKLARELKKHHGYKDSLFWAYEIIKVHNYWQSH